ncbi:MAG: hypothetical protein JNK29_12750, partial [Anaerolineales bacterium]|nr:hypothetical protein [Anaerolineales bacterium]
MTTSPPILTTKLYIPPARHTLVPRPRLTARLSDGLTRPLTLISAPAGSGKSTLVSGWWNNTGGRFPLAWLSLDDEDNDPVCFLSYMVAALATLRPGSGDAALAALQAPQPWPARVVLTSLLNDFSTLATTSALVLDDYHVITTEAIHDTVVFLLDHLPAQLRLVVLTRADPPWPLARLRARDHVAEIRAADLRFTLEEAAVFLNRVMELDLPAEALETLETRTEGWIAGLQLAALSLQGHSARSRLDFVAAFGGSHHYILEYLAEEVLNAQPHALLAFLLQTSILGRLCGPLCEAVVDAGPEQPVDGQAVLEALEHLNLFLIPLDDERHWYRYHHLFADVLSRRLAQQSPQLLPVLHRRASAWYEQHEFIPEAIQHAFLAGGQDRAAQLVEQHGCQLIMRGEVSTLTKWIDAVAADVPAHPWLAVQRAWALSLTGYPDQAESTLEAADRFIAPLEATHDVKILRGTMAAARAHAATMRQEAGQAAERARQALAILPDDNPFSSSLRSTATSLLGDASWMDGDLEAAKHAYREAVRIGEAAGNAPMIIIASTNLADVLLEQGQLQPAAKLYAEILATTLRPDGQREPLADRVYFGLSRVSYEWNRLEAAAQHTHHCLELSRQWGNTDLQAEGWVMLARLEQTQGRPAPAREAMRTAEQLAGEHRLSPNRRLWVRSALARLCLAQGNLEQAAYLVQADAHRGGAEIPRRQLPMSLVQLRVLLAR